jgi:hypothetical protein
MTKLLLAPYQKYWDLNRQIKKLNVIIAALFLFSTNALSQEKFKIGTIDQFQQHFTIRNGANEKSSKVKTLKTKDSQFDIVININKIATDGNVYIGKLKDNGRSNVYFKISKNGLEGSLTLPETKKAYQYHSDESGNVYVTEVDIHTLLCINLEGEQNAGTTTAATTPASIPPPTSPVFQLQSLPTVPYVVLLDFDGQYVSGGRWNGGNPIDAQPGNFTEADITNIWKMVSEDYRPFNLNITTSEAVFQAAAKGRRMRCIFTSTNTAAPGSGGVAYVNSFTWTDDTPCWVFNAGVKGAGEAGSHEVGHTMGLSHDGRNLSSGKEEYANNPQDDVSIIGSSKNGFGFRKDEDGNSTSSAKSLALSTTGSILSSNYGIITTSTDLDYYSFTSSGGNVSITVNPSASYPDLDIILKLLNSSGSVIATSDPTNTQSATLTNSIAAGQYYILVDGTGQGDPFTTGYSDYASIGEYTITGSVPVTVVNQSPSVAITSPTNNASFNAPATIIINANASDADGSIASVEFFNGTQSIGIDNTSPYSATVNNLTAGNYSFTAKAIDNKGATTSTSINVTVKNQANALPTVSITSPANNASFNALASFTFSASANDADGTISSVEFLNGSETITSDNTAPYSITISNLQAGTYTLFAKATDNSGGTATAAITIVVNVVTNDNCATISPYVENGGYAAGSIVKNVGNRYQCKPWPYSGWCNGGSWAYAPGTGTYWSDAWILMGSCSTSASMISSAKLITTPNPFNTNTSVTMEDGEKITLVKLFNSNGMEIFNSGRINSDALIIGDNLEPGYYIIHIETDNKVSIKNLVKTK